MMRGLLSLGVSLVGSAGRFESGRNSISSPMGTFHLGYDVARNFSMAKGRSAQCRTLSMADDASYGVLGPNWTQLRGLSGTFNTVINPSFPYIILWCERSVPYLVTLSHILRGGGDKGSLVRRLPTRSLWVVCGILGWCSRALFVGTAGAMAKDEQEKSAVEIQKTEAEKKGVADGNLAGSDGTLSLILMNKQPEKNTDEVDDDDEFDPDAGDLGAARKWLGIACFYFGKPYNVKTLFAEMSRAWSI